MLKIGTIRGHTALWLENSQLKISVLPEKGADIFEFIHKPSGIDFLMKTPGGLRPPGDKKPVDFLDNYQGGWQELFPNPGDSVSYHGEQLPFHGEVALLPWDYEVLDESESGAEIHLSLRCRQTPFRLERWMRLKPDQALLEIEGRVTNESASPAQFLWGQHVVLGGDFLEAGCLVELPGAKIITPGELYEPATACLAPGQCEPWPFAKSKLSGTGIDLRKVPGREARCHDDVYLTDLEQGRISVQNPRLDMSFVLEWDLDVFGCIVNWRPLGGAEMPPLTGIYGLGIEPWVSRFNLTDAIHKGKALQLEPQTSLTTTLRASITPAIQRV